jgi:hypothetical protein
MLDKHYIGAVPLMHPLTVVQVHRYLPVVDIHTCLSSNGPRPNRPFAATAHL